MLLLDSRSLYGSTGADADGWEHRHQTVNPLSETTTMFTNEQDFGRDAESTSALAEGLACLCLAKDRAEALRYESLLQEMGFMAWAATVSDGDTGAFGVPLFVDANQRDSASEVLAAFEAQWDEEEEEDDFDDEDDEDEELYPDDMDDDFEEDEEDDEEEEDFD